MNIQAQHILILVLALAVLVLSVIMYVKVMKKKEGYANPYTTMTAAQVSAAIQKPGCLKAVKKFNKQAKKHQYQLNAGLAPDALQVVRECGAEYPLMINSQPNPQDMILGGDWSSAAVKPLIN